MSAIDNIKQKILQMEAGEFQGLCDAYLSKIGYQDIVPLGTEPGTRKTTKGTPDTYFVTQNGKYVFVEYTTQKTSLAKKIKSDIQKCLDTSTTGMKHSEISEIIYCHTSSNIKPAQDKEYRDICENAGVKLTVIGIDKLSEDLYLSYPGIARDFLNISIDSNQIQSTDDFIENYNRNKLAAPLDIDFLFRDTEIEKVEESFKKADIVILSGASGVGKTRLALHYARKHADDYEDKLYCISSKGLPIYEDLKVYIDKPGKYFLLIDDANQLTQLSNVVRYTHMKPEGYHVKILITVRDYAIQKVVNAIREVAVFEKVEINKFTDDEIKKLLKTAFGITNPDYHERIIRIAEGNARIAILAGKTASEANRLDSIYDVSQLYDDYYCSALEENLLLADEKLCICAGIVAFLDAIHLDHIDSFLPLLQEKKLSREDFIVNIKKLHELEILDIQIGKAVRFSDQCLSNYMLKYVFYDKKLLCFSAMVRNCFQSHMERTISAVNTLLSVFINEDLITFVTDELLTLWVEYSKGESEQFFEFVKVFYRINPTETLVMLDDMVRAEEPVNVDIATIDINKGKNYQSVTDDIITILGGFADTSDLPAALDLLFMYYEKRPDLFMEFYHGITMYYGIKKDSEKYGYITQTTLFEKLAEYSDGWTKEPVTILFLEIAKVFLELDYSPVEAGRKNTFVMYHIPLVMSEATGKYRELIWIYLSELCKVKLHRERIRELLMSYGGPFEDVSFAVVQFDSSFIESLVNTNFSKSELINCLLADTLRQTLSRANVQVDTLFSEYFKEELFGLYKLLVGPDYTDEIGCDEREKQKREEIEQYVASVDFTGFNKLIDIYGEVENLDNHEAWDVKNGLAIAFDAITARGDIYVDAVKYYIAKDTPGDIYPNSLVSALFSFLSDTEVFNLINTNEFKQKNAWIYSFYHELPTEMITEEHVQELYYYLSDTSDKNIISAGYRDVEFLKKYSAVDKNAFAYGCRLILAKMEYSPYMVGVYFNLLFSRYSSKPQATLRLFTGDSKLLEDVYCAVLQSSRNSDYKGLFLKEIYLIRPSVLDRYIGILTEKKDTLAVRDENKRLRCLFELKDYIHIFDRVLDNVIENVKYPTSSVPHFLETFLLPVEDRQDDWIRHLICSFSDDITKMSCLFSVIARLSAEKRKDYFILFLDNNQSFEDFERIPLTPSSWGWSGSAVPIYSAWIDFFSSLLPYFEGIKWIRHKKYIEDRIAGLKKAIESEEIEQILIG